MSGTHATTDVYYLLHTASKSAVAVLAIISYFEAHVHEQCSPIIGVLLQVVR
jgi:hypothetical protein